jgi:hypothetical protein
MERQTSWKRENYSISAKSSKCAKKGAIYKRRGTQIDERQRKGCFTRGEGT